jgi:transposase
MLRCRASRLTWVAEEAEAIARVEWFAWIMVDGRRVGALARCTKAKYRIISRWEHEHVMEAAQKRLDENPQAMRQRRETVEHPFGTLKMRMGATHFLMKRLPKVATEMALHVLAYNLTRVMNIMGVTPLIAHMRA